MPEIQITKNTSISLGLVIILMGATLAWGTLFATIMNVQSDVGEMRDQIAALDSKFESLLRESALTLSE